MAPAPGSPHLVSPQCALPSLLATRKACSQKLLATLGQECKVLGRQGKASTQLPLRLDQASDRDAQGRDMSPTWVSSAWLPPRGGDDLVFIHHLYVLVFLRLTTGRGDRRLISLQTMFLPSIFIRAGQRHT